MRMEHGSTIPTRKSGPGDHFWDRPGSCQLVELSVIPWQDRTLSLSLLDMDIPIHWQWQPRRYGPLTTNSGLRVWRLLRAPVGRVLKFHVSNFRPGIPKKSWWSCGNWDCPKEESSCLNRLLLWLATLWNQLHEWNLSMDSDGFEVGNAKKPSSGNVDSGLVGKLYF